MDAYITKNFVSPSKKYNREIRDIKDVRIDLFYVGSKKHKIIFSDYEGKEYTVFPPLLSDYYSNKLLIKQINDAIESGTHKTFTIWNTKALKYCLIWTIIILVYICFLKINNIIDFFTKEKHKQQRTDITTQLPKSNENTEKEKYNDINDSIIK